VTAIIDGCGSCGAALGPLLTGYLAELRGGFDNVFAMLYVASLAAALLLFRLVVREVRRAPLPPHVNTYSLHPQNACAKTLDTLCMSS
jgi:OPA family glycerol-3-phosphate transporter-like MFS transporter 1/2